MNSSEIKKITDEALSEISGVPDAPALEALRVKYLGRKGLLTSIMKGLGELGPAERAATGKAANEFRTLVSEKLAQAQQRISASSKKKVIHDVTLPGIWRRLGVRHPLSRVIADTVTIFKKLGFSVAEGPDIETKYNNFDALNTPGHHPSLDQADTFWFENGSLLRTQTSPVQVRIMEKHAPPIRIVTPGRCYRRDTTDATHSANFHQIEGLYVDKKVSLADLKTTLSYFASEMMGHGVKVRFRPHFFPFTEPSVECDFSCHVCGGKGCRVCKHSGWIEIAGAGMVDPRVFVKVGYDPEQYVGYAFGMGIERIAMIKYGVSDIRAFYENDMRFLEQFR